MFRAPVTQAIFNPTLMQVTGVIFKDTLLFRTALSGLMLCMQGIVRLRPTSSTSTYFKLDKSVSRKRLVAAQRLTTL